MVKHELSELLARTMTPEEYKAQRRSWVIGQMMLTHPEMTREKVEEIVDKALGE